MSRRGVHEPGSRLGRRMRAEHHRAGALRQRVVVGHSGEVLPGEVRQHLLRIPQAWHAPSVLRRAKDGLGVSASMLHFVRRAGRQELPEQVLGDDHRALAEVVRDVFDLGIRRDGEVRRDGPRRRGPDGEREGVPFQRRR